MRLDKSLGNKQISLCRKTESFSRALSTQHRRLLFKEILASGDAGEIGRVLTTIYNLKTKLRKTGKKIKVSDERIIKETERSVFAEFAFSLGISPEEIPAYIDDRING